MRFIPKVHDHYACRKAQTPPAPFLPVIISVHSPSHHLIHQFHIPALHMYTMLCLTIIVSILIWILNSLHCLQGLVGGRVNLGTEVGSGSTGSREVSCENWLEEGAEDDLGAVGEWKSEPEDKDELESVVEWEPIDGVDGTFKDSKESKDNPVCEPLSIVSLVNAEQGFQRVISRNHKSSNIGKELASNVEEDEEEVGCDNTEEDVDLGNIGLLLEVVEDRILGKFLINLGDVALSFVLERRHV